MANLTSFRKNLTTLITDTQLLLRDPNGERYATARITEKLNETALEFCLKTQLIKAEINVELEEDENEYDIRGAVEDAIADDATVKPYAWPIRIGYDGDAQPALLPESLLAIDLKAITLGVSGMPQVFYLCATTYGVIQVLNPPAEDGDTPPLETGNLQVTYIGMPIAMSAGGDYPDTIPAYFHKYLPYGAAALILEEGDKNEMALSDYYEAEFKKGCVEQVKEEYASRTPYNDVHPL